MIKHGFPAYLECSSKGDARFSAFQARIKARGNQSIESIYQAAKVFEDGTTGLDWREAKSKRPVNIMQVRALYSTLWQEYIKENPDLVPELLSARGLSDMFGQPGSACQATELWEIRQSIMLLDIEGFVRVTNKRAGSSLRPDADEVLIAVDRSNPVLGNPFILKNVNDDRERYKVIDNFSSKLYADMLAGGPMLQEVQNLADRLVRGENVCLDCWCAPKPCHGHVIAAAAVERAWRLIHGMSPDFDQEPTVQPEAPRNPQPKLF
ncbi:DUF4326 domain-containing protein [Methylobacillus sp. Pita2]|uniref:DUF4326 domain-containing protein n=1 Tax=Methylobacillus sp. Pita2 TaxID=3383245 RepID=UPI0038B5520A